MFVLVGGWPGSGKSTLATALAQELGLPLCAKDAVKESLMDALGSPADVAESRRLGRAAVLALLATARELPGAVLDSTWYDYTRPLVDLLPGPKVEVRCHVPPSVARARYHERDRDPRHLDDQRSVSELWGRPAAPLGIGPLIEVDTSRRVDVSEIAAAIRAAAGEDGAMADPARAPAFDALEQIYGQVSTVVRTFDDAAFAGQSRCVGWDRQALLVHMLADARRALVTFATPGDRTPDVDSVSYWAEYEPKAGDGATAHGEFIRMSSAAYTSPEWVRQLWLETAAAAVRAGRGCSDRAVTTQGHVLTVADFVDTLVVEATVHYLDLTVGLEAEDPAGSALDITVQTLNGLLGFAASTSMGAVEYALKGTGRESLTDEDRARLGRLAERFPLLG
ncbi:MAG: AAA family ATPase [Nocardioidaceae bacterium]